MLLQDLAAKLSMAMELGCCSLPLRVAAAPSRVLLPDLMAVEGG